MGQLLHAVRHSFLDEIGGDLFWQLGHEDLSHVHTIGRRCSITCRKEGGYETGDGHVTECLLQSLRGRVCHEPEHDTQALMTHLRSRRTCTTHPKTTCVPCPQRHAVHMGTTHMLAWNPQHASISLFRRWLDGMRTGWALLSPEASQLQNTRSTGWGEHHGTASAPRQGPL